MKMKSHQILRSDGPMQADRDNRARKRLVDN